MRELHCIDCGGNDFIRREEIYLCASCGREYSALDLIELTEDNKVEQKTLKTKKGSITEKSKNHHPKKSLSHYESRLKRNSNDWEALFNTVYLKAEKAELRDIIPSITKLMNIYPKVLNLIKNNDLEENKELEAISEVYGSFQIIAASFKNSGEVNNSKLANEAYAKQINKEWYLRVLQLTKLFFSFGDDLESIFDGKYREISLNSYKTAIWYYLDIIKLADDKEIHIRKIRTYEEKIRLDEPDYESKLKTKIDKKEDSFLGRLFSRK